MSNDRKETFPIIAPESELSMIYDESGTYYDLNLDKIPTCADCPLITQTTRTHVSRKVDSGSRAPGSLLSRNLVRIFPYMLHFTVHQCSLTPIKCANMTKNLKQLQEFYFGTRCRLGILCTLRKSKLSRKHFKKAWNRGLMTFLGTQRGVKGRDTEEETFIWNWSPWWLARFLAIVCIEDCMLTISLLLPS